MKFVTSLLIALIVVANLVFAQPSLADKPKFLKNPDYIEVNKALNDLKAVQQAQVQTENYNPEDIQKKIDELEFQKYALETGINWGQCRNETGKTIAVYGPKPKFDDDDDDYEYQYDNGLYFLANGQTTEQKWDCQGVYIPNDAQIAGITSDDNNQAVEGPVAIKVSDGTQLVVQSNADTGALEFSIPPTRFIKPAEANWFIPNIAQSMIETRVANAPTVKNAANQLVVMTSLKKDSSASTTAAKDQPKAQAQPQEQRQEQPQAQPQSQPSAVRAGYVNRR
ncbi:MAG TPA: hypothetical protein V6D11_30470 [Waterburya sp.]|jgi:hypothetical protein